MTWIVLQFFRVFSFRKLIITYDMTLNAYSSVLRNVANKITTITLSLYTLILHREMKSRTSKIFGVPSKNFVAFFISLRSYYEMPWRTSKEWEWITTYVKTISRVKTLKDQSPHVKRHRNIGNGGWGLKKPTSIFPFFEHIVPFYTHIT